MFLIKLIWVGLIYWFCPNAAAQAYQATLSDGSAFVLKGSSNINEFKLAYTGDFGNTNKVHIEKDNNKTNVKSIHTLNLKVEHFISANTYITKDFRKMLRADTYPNLSIEPLNVWLQKNQPNKVTALINLTIAGCTKQELINLILTDQKANQIQCKGTHRISLKRYGLQAPKKALGAVQVKDEVDIATLLNLQYKKIN